MFDLFNNGHTYTLASTGIRVRTRTYPSRQQAEEKMYKLCRKYGLQILEQYHDNHDRTYKCQHGINFYIQRQF